MSEKPGEGPFGKSPVHPQDSPNPGCVLGAPWHNPRHGKNSALHQTRQEAEGLDFPPVPGEIGKKLWQSVSKQAWQEWIRQQTMLVNEYRLNLSDVKARKYLAQQMENHFFGTGADTASGYVPPKD